MKKVIIAIAVVVGIAGLIAVLNYKPSTSATTSTQLVPTSGSSSTSSQSAAASYKDGTYTGSAEQNEYGPVQVSVIIRGGKISSISMLQVPNDHRNSRELSAYSTPVLIKEAISAQSSNVDIVSGATDTSVSFSQSLQTALDQAKI